MNAYQRALYTLNNDPCYKIEEYTVIDELIEPLCKLLTENGYITLHSCSAHVVNKFGNKDNQWNLVFVATKTIKHIKEVLKKIKKKYGYNLILEKSDYYGLTRRWFIEYYFAHDFDEVVLEEVNKNITDEFRNYFKHLK
jgi:hypothetical protein